MSRNLRRVVLSATIACTAVAGVAVPAAAVVRHSDVPSVSYPSEDWPPPRPEPVPTTPPPPPMAPGCPVCL